MFKAEGSGARMCGKEYVIGSKGPRMVNRVSPVGVYRHVERSVTFCGNSNPLALTSCLYGLSKH